jgi:hypothetical protein
VLLNLLSNAVKYNREGGNITLTAAETSHGTLRLTVGDTGEGITSPGIEKLFTPFERLRADATSAQIERLLAAGAEKFIFETKRSGSVELAELAVDDKHVLGGERNLTVQELAEKFVARQKGEGRLARSVAFERDEQSDGSSRSGHSIGRL